MDKDIDFRIVKFTHDDGSVRYIIERFYPSFQMLDGCGWIHEAKYKWLWCAKRRLKWLRRVHKLDIINKENILN
jgi:hypothetical protein